MGRNVVGLTEISDDTGSLVLRVEPENDDSKTEISIRVSRDEQHGRVD